MTPTKNLSATAHAFKGFLLQHIDHLVAKYANLTPTSHHSPATHPHPPASPATLAPPHPSSTSSQTRWQQATPYHHCLATAVQDYAMRLMWNTHPHIPQIALTLAKDNRSPLPTSSAPGPVCPVGNRSKTADNARGTLHRSVRPAGSTVRPPPTSSDPVRPYPTGDRSRSVCSGPDTQS